MKYEIYDCCGEIMAQGNTHRKLEKEAQRRFLHHLNEAHKAMYDAGIENKGAILSMNIKDLYQYFSTLPKN